MDNVATIVLRFEELRRERWVSWPCATCGENNGVIVESIESDAQIVEDCRVCCRPNLLTTHVDHALHQVVLTVRSDL